MADIVYHLRQASTLTRYARLTRNRERAAELLQLTEQHRSWPNKKRGCYSKTRKSLSPCASNSSISAGLVDHYRRRA
jgi:hypothetical protein